MECTNVTFAVVPGSSLRCDHVITDFFDLDRELHLTAVSNVLCNCLPQTAP